MNDASQRSVWRRLERRLVGVVMAIMAYGLEKSILRSIRRGSKRPPPASSGF